MTAHLPPKPDLRRGLLALFQRWKASRRRRRHLALLRSSTWLERDIGISDGGPPPPPPLRFRG